jgi:hypothetical protein
LRSLSGREREALLLVAWDGLDPARAAGAAGCSGWRSARDCIVPAGGSALRWRIARRTHPILD